jgi:hypothetical protein
LFKKNPLKIIRGTRRGAESPRATLTLGETADKNDPKETAQLETSTIATTQRTNFPNSEFSPAIQ